MNRISQAGTFLGTAALSLAAVAGPAAGATHTNAKPTKLVHTHLTLKATQERVTKNDKFKATVVAKLRARKAGLAGETVDLEQHAKGATKWVDTGLTGTTAADGTASFAFVQGATTVQYRVVFAGDSAYAKSHSGTVTIRKFKAASAS